MCPFTSWAKAYSEWIIIFLKTEGEKIVVTQEQVMEKRQYFLDRKYPVFEIFYDLACLECFVLPQACCPELPHFAIQMVASDWRSLHTTRNTKGTAIFGVSESIPEEFRPMIVRHEMDEYLGNLTCVQSSIRELTEFLNSKHRGRWEEYVNCRRALFSVLPEFALAHKYSPEKIAEFTKSQILFGCAY